MKNFIQRKEMCMKNKITDLNDHLFAQIERLSDEDISEEDLEIEIKRAKAVTDVAEKIINNANLALQAEKYRFEVGISKCDLPQMLESKSK